VAGCAVIRLRGGDPTVGDGLRIATNAGCGSWLRFLRHHRHPAAACLRIVEVAGQTGRRVVRHGLFHRHFLVIPILAVEGVARSRAFPPLDRHAQEDWGEQLERQHRLGLISFLACVPAMAFPGSALMSPSRPAWVPGLLLAGLYLLA